MKICDTTGNRNKMKIKICAEVSRKKKFMIFLLIVKLNPKKTAIRKTASIKTSPWETGLP